MCTPVYPTWFIADYILLSDYVHNKLDILKVCNVIPLCRWLLWNQYDLNIGMMDVIICSLTKNNASKQIFGTVEWFNNIHIYNKPQLVLFFTLTASNQDKNLYNVESEVSHNIWTSNDGKWKPFPPSTTVLFGCSDLVLHMTALHDRYIFWAIVPDALTWINETTAYNFIVHNNNFFVRFWNV